MQKEALKSVEQDKNQKILAYSPKKSVEQEQLHDILFSREIGWQELIYDLINAEQLDPWNIDITILTDKYLEKIGEGFPSKLTKENPG